MSRTATLPQPTDLTLGSATGVVTWGQGMNLINIVGLLTDKEIPAIFAMMDQCEEAARTKNARRNIGFYLDSAGGTHDAIKQIVAKIEYYRSEHKFNFYVEIKLAQAEVVLIVALSDKDKRAICNDGEIIIDDGRIQVGLSDFMENGHLYPGHFERLRDAVEFYRANLWSPTRLDFRKLDGEQTKAYRESGTLRLSAEQCIKLFDFKSKG